MGIRKNAARLSPTERDNFLRAALTLKHTIANPGAPANQQISIFDQFVAIHLYTLSINVPGGGAFNMGHQNSAFCPWHRYYLLRFEQALQAVDPTVTLPYWDWTDHAASQNIIFQDDFLGPNGGAGGVGGGTVRSGYFAFDRPGAGANPTPLPAWWPGGAGGLPGWRVKSQLQQGWGSTLQRSFSPFGQLETQADVQTCLAKLNYENPGGFRPFLEGGGPLQMHNGMHGWVGGNMGDPNSSPNDLIFYMHHCNIDRLWAMWQIDGHQGAAFYPAVGRPQGHNLNDPMWPWVGGLAGYSSNNSQLNIVIPDFTGEPIQHPADLLDHRALGFAYDTEVVLGVALDQTGSMTGLTPDPLTGMAPNISKWEAAKQGVSALLHDCEAAYTAAEAYVVAGVETFRSTGAGNTFTQIFPGAHFGVVKNGGAVSQLNFEANIAAQSPNGGTPLAGALTDTDTNLVRAPFTNQPAGDQRYLSILTDGMATAPPPLSSLGTPAFPDTIIFAMGFGIGGGWDGVDYTTIADMTTKGKTAPAGVNQVFHGENAGVIDKFYTNSVAASIGYTPSVDPIFDLYPGEHVHLRFDVTEADQGYMITAQGFDFNDGNWDFCLMAPNGMHCADTRVGAHGPSPATSGHGGRGHSHGGSTEVLAPFLVTMKQRRGRCTIFLNRNGADGHVWAGRWHFMAYYKADPDEPLMVMPSLADFTLPTGAPPVRGPLYSRFALKPAERLPVRAVAGSPAHQLATGLNGVSTTSPDAPCAVSINIFNRTSNQASLTATAKEPFAGEDITLTLKLSDMAGGTYDLSIIAARMVAPNHALGNALADLQTIPVKNRRQYLNRGNTEEPFNLLQYLAAYEEAKPGAFAIRDEEIVFKQKDANTWTARVKGNAFPGVYRFGVYVEGTYTHREEEEHEGEKDKSLLKEIEECCGHGPQRYTRSLHTEIALGIKPDEKQSRPALHWLAPNKFVVSVALRDAQGNVALPTPASTPTLTVNGLPVRVNVLPSLTGEHQLEGTVSGKGLKLTPEGQSLQGTDITLDAETGDKVSVKPGETLKVGIEVSGRKLKVETPKLVGDRETLKVFAAGSSEALKLTVENRQPLATKKEARDLGFKPD